uniref:Uncharacterized aarF domain-containing protein kinase 5 n=2 Tax=Culex pipiens TaxID=7175 RepID=A0A8D8D5I4_CULPI
MYRFGLFGRGLRRSVLHGRCQFKTAARPTERRTWTPARLFFGTSGGLLLGTVGYDWARNDFENVDSVQRFVRSLGIGVSISVDYGWTMWRLKEDDPDYSYIMSELHLRSAEKILRGCLANGGLYIKLGQGVATFSHIIPKEYIQTMRKLEDKCLTRKSGEVKRLFKQDFGLAPEDMFDQFDYEPIAAASLAQVFRGVTKEGHKVAIKVQYADLRKRFDGDLRTIIFLQDLVGLMHKNYNFGWIARDLQNTLREELDFIHEGKNSERCAEDLKTHDHIYVPKVIWKYTKERVLTTEFIDGCKISDHEGLKRLKANLAHLDTRLFQAFAEQIFRTGFVHADPHPGNIFVRKHPTSGRLQLVLLDHGLYGKLSLEVRNNLSRFWEAIVLKDHADMKKYAKALNVEDYKTFAEILLQRPLEVSGSKMSTRLTDEDLAYMSAQAKDHFDKVMTTLKSMPRNIIFVLRNLNTIRSIAWDHGDPVDRAKVMARCAIAALRQTNRSFGMYVNAMFRRVRFEYYLWKSSFQFWLVGCYLRVLTGLGRAPADTTHLLRGHVVDV